MSGTINATVTPYMKGSQVKWDLTVGGKHGGYGQYPHIQPSHGSTLISITIQNGQGWTFAKDAAALWVSDNGKDPTGPSSVPGVINPNTVHTSNHDLTLSFTDSNPAAGQINYTLNFVKAGQQSSTLDPIIDNTGPGRTYNTLWYAIGAVAVALLLYLFLRPMLTRKDKRP